jgi:hypothetical protein
MGKKGIYKDALRDEAHHSRYSIDAPPSSAHPMPSNAKGASATPSLLKLPSLRLSPSSGLVYSWSTRRVSKLKKLCYGFGRLFGNGGFLEAVSALLRIFNKLFDFVKVKS